MENKVMNQGIRRLAYLSPSGISKFRNDQEEFYLRYIATHRGPDEPQNQAMSIGSAFDAYAKSFISERLFGKGFDPKYEFQALFEAQVSPEWRDWARLHGMYLFDKYQTSGALADLMLDLQQAINVPKFEIEIMGTIHSPIAGYQREGMTMVKEGVVFLGKPDVFYINKAGGHVIIDWKVNGYVSKYVKYPMKGYIRTRLGNKSPTCHKECVLKIHNGSMINTALSLHELNTDWATQLSIYSWLSGAGVGEDFIAGIDQICCSPNGTEFPDIQIAEHRMLVAPKFQHEVFDLAQNIWERAHSDHFFRDMTKEESRLRCEMLNNHFKDLAAAKVDPAFLEMTKKPNYYQSTKPNTL